MHSKNPYADGYNLKELAVKHRELQKHLKLSPKGEQTVDFSDPQAVFELNKALLLVDFGLRDYSLPSGYLIPPVPGRLEYLLHLDDVLKTHQTELKTGLKGLDIGAGANGIYCILAAQHLNWSMVGAETEADAVRIANANLQRAPGLSARVEMRQQANKSFLFRGIVKPGEYFDFTVCNPPFYRAKEEAAKATRSKQKNLGQAPIDGMRQNFAGQANELWCNGGEALFIKRLIKESVLFKDQIGVFSSLVAMSTHLPKIEKQLTKTKANYKIIPMELGNKKSRIVCWWFE